MISPLGLMDRSQRHLTHPMQDLEGVLLVIRGYFFHLVLARLVLPSHQVESD